MMCKLLILSVLAALPLVGCGSSDSGGATGTGGATATGGSTGTGGATATGGSTGTGGATATGGSTGTGGMAGSATPPVPTIGAQIDRMGRPAINTALTAPFNPDADKQGAFKDKYNAAAQDKWSADYKSAIAGNLAILDSLDTKCGNQFAAGAEAKKGRYDALAGVLADDQLYVNSDGKMCTVYLAVEANATNIIANADCGGRTPMMDVIDVSYSVLAIGALKGVDDGVAADDATHSLTDFPFLAPAK